MNTPRETIAEYVDACRAGSDDRLKEIFLPGAVMSGFFEGEFYVGSPELFFDEIRDNPLPENRESEYIGQITSVETWGSVASVVLEEKGYLGKYSLTNLFQLVCREGLWKIVAKSYTDDC